MWWIVIVLAVIVVLIFSAAYAAFVFAFGARKSHAGDPVDATVTTELAQYADRINLGMEEGRKLPKEDVFIESHDGLKLHGYFIPAEKGKLTVLCVHGYRGDSFRDFSCAVTEFNSKGYNVMLIDQRTHGRSEGRYITMGIHESRDCIKWLEYLEKRMGADHPVFMDGVSMGATTVLMATGMNIPSNTKGVIADCGYNSPYEIVKHVMKNMMHIQAGWLLPFVDIYCRLLAKFSMKELTATKSLENCKIPVLFAHGLKDTFVPSYMGIENYNACPTEKELLLVENAGHGLSYFENKEEYDKRIDKLFQNR